MCNVSPYGRCNNSRLKTAENARANLKTAETVLREVGENSPEDTDAAFVEVINRRKEYLQSLVSASDTDFDAGTPTYAKFKEEAAKHYPQARQQSIDVHNNFANHPLMESDKAYAKLMNGFGSASEGIAKDLEKHAEKEAMVRALHNSSSEFQQLHLAEAEVDLATSGSQLSVRLNMLRAKQATWAEENNAPEKAGNSEHGILVEETLEDGTVERYGMGNVIATNPYIAGRTAEYVQEAKNSDGRIKVYATTTQRYEMGSKVERPADWDYPTEGNGVGGYPRTGNCGYKQIKDNGQVRLTSDAIHEDDIEQVVEQTREVGKKNRIRVSNSPYVDKEVYSLKASETNHNAFGVKWEYKEDREQLA